MTSMRHLRILTRLPTQRPIVFGLLALFVFPNAVVAQDTQSEFFEAKVRPILVERCYACHSAESDTPEAGLYLDRATGPISGGESGPAIVPGKPEESLLVRAVRYEENEMPPDRKLSDGEIDVLVKWIEMGAEWPDEQPPAAVTTDAGYDWDYFRREHWSLQPISKPTPPEVRDQDWPIKQLDRFVLARIESQGLRPVSPASARILVRRLYFDLIGLPPTPSQVDQFEVAARQDRQLAVESLVDDLLASPHYGERWGRHWLDVARYSDGYGGFLDSRSNNHAWRYRDWVVNALNEDLPYDEFIKLQIAGDLYGGRKGTIATGFFALGPEYQSDGGDPDSVAQARSETLDDRMDTFSRGLLALTVSCARCHDHKFDPIPQIDYYSLAGVFHNSQVHEAPLVSQDVVNAYNSRQDSIKEIDQQIRELEKKSKSDKRELTQAESDQIERWKGDLKQLRETAPAKYATAHALHDTGSGNLRVALRGNARKPGEEAPRRFLKILSGESRTAFTSGSGRAQLAEAIASPKNPLTARVIVNRIWLQHFGKAIVRSPSNFGYLGEKPTHPLLLDWLASTFIDSGWSMKSLHRQIMTSATYQLSSQYDERNFEVDGDNRLIWRMNPRRMDVEVWRDSLLAVADELDLEMGGPPLDDLIATNRRTLYAKVSRNGDVFASDRFLRLFDFPLMRATVAKRPKSIVPQQFLFLMNSQFMVARAEAFASKLERIENGNDDPISSAYRWLFGRLPSESEMSLGRNFLAERSPPDHSDVEGDKLRRLVQYVQVLLSSNEFMYVR